MVNITTASHAAGLSVPAFARKHFGLIMAGEMEKMRKYPKTMRIAKRMARRSGVPLGMILAQVNFSSLKITEQWSNLSLFTRIVQRFLGVFGKARYNPK